MAAPVTEATWPTMSKVQTFCPFLSRAPWLLSDRHLSGNVHRGSASWVCPHGELLVLPDVSCAPWCALCSLLYTALPADSLLSLIILPFPSFLVWHFCQSSKTKLKCHLLLEVTFFLLRGESIFLISAAIVFSTPWVPYSMLQKLLNSCLIHSLSS